MQDRRCSALNKHLSLGMGSCQCGVGGGGPWDQRTSFCCIYWFLSLPPGRKREWFKIEDAIKVLQYHKPVQASYFETLRQGCLANNGTPVMTTPYSESSVSDIRWLTRSLREQFPKADWDLDFPPLPVSMPPPSHQAWAATWGRASVQSAAI